MVSTFVCTVHCCCENTRAIHVTASNVRFPDMLSIFTTVSVETLLLPPFLIKVVSRALKVYSEPSTADDDKNEKDNNGRNGRTNVWPPPGTFMPAVYKISFYSASCVWRDRARSIWTTEGCFVSYNIIKRLFAHYCFQLYLFCWF